MGDTRFETAKKDSVKKDSVKKDEKQKFKTKKFGNFLYVKNQYFDFETNITQQKSDFSGYSLEVKNADGSLLSIQNRFFIGKRKCDVSKNRHLGQKSRF